MKCSKCGYNTVDWAATCKKCGTGLRPKVRSRITYQNVSGSKDRGSGYEKSMSYGRTAEEREKTKDTSYIPTLFESGEESPPPEPPRFRRAKRILTQDKEVEAKGPTIDSTFLPPGSDEPLSEGSVEFGESQLEEFTQGEQTLSFDLAGVGSRAIAFFIDAMILVGLTVVVLGAGMSVAGIDFDTASGLNELIWSYLGVFLLSSTYFIFLHAAGGKTVGKMICKIRVIQDNGELLGFRKAFLRWIGYTVSSILPIGFFWAFFDSKGQAWHDKIAGTYVVNEQPVRVQTFLKR